MLASPPDFAAWLTWRSPLWNWTPREARSALAAAGGEARWDGRRDALGVSGPWRFGPLEVSGAELLFSGRRPVRWQGLLYDRTTQGQASLGWLESLFATATNTVGLWAASAPMEMTRPDGWNALVWGRCPHIVAVEWMPQGGGSTAIGRLRIVAEPWPPRRDWPARVERTGQGDRHVSVPMVDQRFQGYCAPATVERIMRYYGIPMEASAMGRLAESTPEAGTNVQRMLGELSRLRGLRCDVREFFGFDVRRFDRILVQYNREAKRQGKPLLSYAPPELDLARVFAAADPEILGAVTSRQSDQRVFWREVRTMVDAGYPLMWGVVLGLVPESAGSMRIQGGHLRLIVGYNASSREILYSDSWGTGHECKRMSLADAWTMTMTLHALVPPP